MACKRRDSAVAKLHAHPCLARKLWSMHGSSANKKTKTIYANRSAAMKRRYILESSISNQKQHFCHIQPVCRMKQTQDQRDDTPSVTTRSAMHECHVHDLCIEQYPDDEGFRITQSYHQSSAHIRHAAIPDARRHHQHAMTNCHVARGACDWHALKAMLPSDVNEHVHSR